MQFLKYAILFVSIILVLDLTAYFLLDVKPVSSPENNAIRNVFVTTNNFVNSAVLAVSNAVEQSLQSASEDNEETAEADATENQTEEIEQEERQEQEAEEKEQDECLEKFNLTNDTIIFYYSNDVHSGAMIPAVDELKNIYKFHMTTELWNYEFNQCFDLSGTVPTFVCAGSKEKIEGEVSQAELEDFCGKC